MHTARLRVPASVALTALLLLTLPGCATVGDVLADMGGYDDRASVITGEVRSVDSRRGQLQIRDDRDRRNVNVRYDSRTRVTYGQRQYPASSLERGDIVRVSLSRDRSGGVWADRVDVRSSARDNRNASTRVQRVDGTVRTVDLRRGYFAVDQQRGAMVVHVPPRIGNNEARRFERLRRGDRVRADVRPIGNNQAELVRFR
jgi:hypothetical protein